MVLNAESFHSPKTVSGGYCGKCNTVHSLGSGLAAASCLTLMKLLDFHGSINLFEKEPDDCEELKTEYLFGSARGKMFGVMECIQPDGTPLSLYAFSGQYNGRWKVQGWVPPLFDVDIFYTTGGNKEKKIKSIGREIDRSISHSEKWLRLRKKRRELSQSLTRDIHNLYRLTNFHGETATLSQAYNGKNAIPTGTGDCCAPKLFDYAARNNLIPLGIAEFYWGRENKSTTRQHGCFYSSCKEKCGPILGFMLCGLDNYDKA